MHVVICAPTYETSPPPWVLMSVNEISKPEMKHKYSYAAHKLLLISFSVAYSKSQSSGPLMPATGEYSAEYSGYKGPEIDYTHDMV